MGKRYDYEHLELDNDNNYYWFMNSDVDSPYKEPLLKEFVKWWNEDEVDQGLYYKGTRLYFTFGGKKYYVSWTFYDERHIKKGVAKLKELGATNIQINYGELD